MKIHTIRVFIYSFICHFDLDSKEKKVYINFDYSVISLQIHAIMIR